MHLTAGSLPEADAIAHNVLHSLLSQWSYRFNIGLDIGTYEIVEESTQARIFRFGALGRQHALSKEELFQVRDEFRGVMAAYREGLNTSNVFYKFLCFYKVVEAARKIRTKRLR